MSDKPKQTRNVVKKKLFVCEGYDPSEDKQVPPDEAVCIRILDGPFEGINAAVKHIKDDMPEGQYVLMYEGKTINKFTEKIKRLDVSA